VIPVARAQPGALVIGIDADAAALRERSAAAARPADRGGLPNALFLAAGAEHLPPDLEAIADELCVTLPWGSLLRGAIAPEAWFRGLVGRLLRPGGTARLVLSTGPREVAAGLPPLDGEAAHGLAAAYARAGLEPMCVRSLTAADVDGLGSSWAKRLGIPVRREAWRLDLRAN
jgi:16S rRNA (adenine(1408)-N(1))-methyltransferase